MKSTTSTTVVAQHGVLLAAAIATVSCMTPGQSQSMHSQLVEIRRQVDTLKDQQSRNGIVLRDVAAGTDRPRGAPATASSAAVETPLGEETIDAPADSIAEEKGIVSTQAPVEGAAVTKETSISQGVVLQQPGALYRRGYVLYHQGEYARAEEALGSFLLAEPVSPHADNARYWIGECRYARGLYHEAIEAFREVIDRHPGGGKASHALYKIALSFERLGETGGMQKTLQDLLERFPESDVAPLARSRLGGA